MAVVGSGVKCGSVVGRRLQEALAGFQHKLAEELRVRKIKTSKSDAARGLISGQRVIGKSGIYIPTTFSESHARFCL
jgi:hypothetical protein